MITPRSDRATTPFRPERDLERALGAWREHDAAHALHAHDRSALGAADALRALVLDELAAPRPARDLYSACARLGRLLAEHGASPSLTVTTLDGAARALDDLGASWDRARLAPARASAAEGYVSATLEASQARARRAWDYPACAVRISDDAVALVAGLADSEDAETVADWAARVALAVSRDGYKVALVASGGAARAELVEALGMVGIKTKGAGGPDAPAEPGGPPAPWHARLSSLFR